MKLEMDDNSSWCIFLSILVIGVAVFGTIAVRAKYDRDIQAFKNGYEKHNTYQNSTDTGWVKK